MKDKYNIHQLHFKENAFHFFKNYLKCTFIQILPKSRLQETNGSFNRHPCLAVS